MGDKQVLVISCLNELIERLRDVFESDCVDVDYVRALLAAYKSNPKDWKQYAVFDPHRYTRNLVDVGNDRFNLMALCWGEGHGSSVHDHSDAHCFVKVLDGQLKETMFNWPTGLRTQSTNGSDIDGLQHEPLRQTDVNHYDKDGVTYINDSMGLHRVENASHTSPAVSLHLYSPPFQSCRSFDLRTGMARTVRTTFWSKNGRRTSPADISGTGAQQRREQMVRDDSADSCAVVQTTKE